MATFITIGKHTINLEQVTDIEWKKDEAIVFVTSLRPNDSYGRAVRLKDEDRALLRFWIDRIAHNVTQPQEESEVSS